jgi:hypothetical protein
MDRRTFIVSFFALILLIFMGCSNKITDTTGQLRLDISGLGNLGQLARYEAWLVVNGTPISAGKFSVNDQGVLSTTNFSVEKDILNAATSCFISVEPSPDPLTSPSNHIILGGDFADESATSTPLYINNPLALNNDFNSATGKYVLQSPTDNISTNQSSGVWFMDISSGFPQTGLDLPTLPAHWKYEAWAVIEGHTLSMGKFTANDQSDDSSYYCGTDHPQLSYPGEDFVNHLPAGIATPVMMNGKNIFITIEPDPDFSTEPFFIAILKASINTLAVPNFTYSMQNQDIITSLIGRAFR